MNNDFSKLFVSKAFPIIVAGTVILIVAYAAVQQDLRQSANDPQIELAEDAAAILSEGYPIDSLIGSVPKTDMSKSLSPFVMLIDASGNLIESSGMNGTSTPSAPPVGIFDHVRAYGEDRVTWQTASGLRFAAVVTEWQVPARPPAQLLSGAPSLPPASSTVGFVVAARPLREVEIREDKVGKIMLSGWVLMVAGVTGAIWLEHRIERKRGKR